MMKVAAAGCAPMLQKEWTMTALIPGEPEAVQASS